MDCLLAHGGHNANLLSIAQANISLSRQIPWRNTLHVMSDSVKPFADIAERLRWHRSLQGVNQDEYAAKIGFKRSIYSLWEASIDMDGLKAIQLSSEFVEAVVIFDAPNPFGVFMRGAYRCEALVKTGRPFGEDKLWSGEVLVDGKTKSEWLRLSLGG